MGFLIKTDFGLYKCGPPRRGCQQSWFVATSSVRSWGLALREKGRVAVEVSKKSARGQLWRYASIF